MLKSIAINCIDSIKFLRKLLFHVYKIFLYAIYKHDQRIASKVVYLASIFKFSWSEEMGNKLDLYKFLKQHIYELIFTLFLPKTNALFY